MTCDAAHRLIALQIDGEISDRQKAHLAVHLQSCLGCRNELSAQRQFADQISVSAEEIAVPPHPPLSEVVRRTPPITAAPRRRLLPALALAGAAMVACAWGGTLLLRPQKESAPSLESINNALAEVRSVRISFFASTGAYKAKQPSHELWFDRNRHGYVSPVRSAEGNYVLSSGGWQPDPEDEHAYIGSMFPPPMLSKLLVALGAFPWETAQLRELGTVGENTLVLSYEPIGQAAPDTQAPPDPPKRITLVIDEASGLPKRAEVFLTSQDDNDEFVGFADFHYDAGPPADLAEWERLERRVVRLNP